MVKSIEFLIWRGDGNRIRSCIVCNYNGSEEATFFVYFWQPIDARNSILWIKLIVQGSVNNPFLLQLL